MTDASVLTPLFLTTGLHDSSGWIPEPIPVRFFVCD